MECKATRICWNSNGWIKPSGCEDKSKDKKSFEMNPGYGHEEWIFDLTKTISGFKYAFLQGVNTPNKSHQGKYYKVNLFTVYQGKKLCVGYIKKMECLTREQAEVAAGVYQSNNWFGEMQDQLETINLNSINLIEDDPLLNFNIRFMPDDLVIYDTPKDVSLRYKSARYKLLSDEHNISHDTPLIDDILEVMDADLSLTEKQQLVKARVGQGLFRERVAQTWGSEVCAVTLVDIREMLIASHIKPWSECQDSTERLDGANGLLLCAHIDKLFDQHLLSFEQRNKRFYLRTSKNLDKKTLSLLGITAGIELGTSHLKVDDISRFEKYMSEHFEQFTQKQNES